MINNRMLAVAAVLVMAVPALGAATPIVVPPVPEQLVEGHTVFTTIEISNVYENESTTYEVRFAAAVAVLVREYSAAGANEKTASRFPGVLWFNDQYLVNPYQNVQNANEASFRYPCGGSVIAVNRGDPDPRMAIARVNTGNPEVIFDGSSVVAPGTVDGEIGDNQVNFGTTEYTYDDTWVKPYPGTYYYGQDAGADGTYGTADDAPASDYAWIGVTPDNGQVNLDDQTVSGQMVYSDTVVGSNAGGIDGNLFNLTAPWDYRESYLITDPNDHSWIIDKYEFYTRDSNAGSQNEANIPEKLDGGADANGDGIPESEDWPVAGGGNLQTSYAYPVWVVNMLGSPVFVPDGLPGAANCAPFKDLIEEVAAPLDGALCGLAAPNPLGTGADDELTLNAYNGAPTWTDDPCMSYQEPSRNGFCYGGQTAEDADNDADIDADDCLAEREEKPLRQYNALLYFKLEDLYVFDAPRDHCNFDPTLFGGAGGCNPALSGDTNGCSEEGYPWAPADETTPWPCPSAPAAGANGEQVCSGPALSGDGAPGEDDCEGNSHPFHPTTPSHNVAEECIDEFYVGANANNPDGTRANKVNHGGSSYITPGMRANDAGWYEMQAPCDYLHATRNIDIYFNGAGRPFPPVVRNFNVVDLEGSSAPFNDYHCAYETAPSATGGCPPPETAASPIPPLPEP